LCIAIGVYNVWKSFERFDNSIIAEKDTQLYSLMRSGDINLENSINAIERETETFLGRKQLQAEIENWRDSGSRESLQKYISSNTLVTNPIYADLVMNYKDRILCTASGNRSYTPVTGSDASGLSIFSDDNDAYYLAFHQDAGEGITYDVLIDLTRLYSMAIGSEAEREIMLIDAASVIAMAPSPDGVRIMPIGAETDEKTSDFRDFMVSC
jgi:hypothetical protein